MTSDLAAVVEAVQRSKRYQTVSPEVVARLAGEEIPKSRNQADAQKRTKRRLHQIFGAYTQPLPYAAIAARIADENAELESLCRWVLGLHASTRERLPLLDTFYSQIFAITGRPDRLLDVACGLNPFAWPWMGLDTDCQYLAFDIDTQLRDLVDSSLTRFRVDHQVDVADGLTFTPPPADVALLLKAVPCLEQQRPGAGLALLDRVVAPHVVVSYPTRSLGGRTKGMARTYRAQFGAMLDQRQWRYHELEFASELVFIIDTRP